MSAGPARNGLGRLSAARRLRHTRILMTAVFAATTALCMAFIAVLAVQIDASSRTEQLAARVDERAGGLARAIYFDEDSLHLEPLAGDELAQGQGTVAVVRTGFEAASGGLVYRTSTAGADADPQLLDTLAAEVNDTGETVRESARSRQGSAMLWSAAPVWNGDEIGAVVVVGQDATVDDAARQRLIVGLVVACAGLVVVAAAAGFLLSGRAMRPAITAISSQEQFLAEAAHELRTPLSTLRLQAESGDVNPRRVTGIVDRLDHLVSALLARARVQSGAFEPERVPLRLDQLVEHVLDEYDGVDGPAEQAVPAVVVGDPVLIEQAVRNLIDNALRYAPDGEVRVSVIEGGVIVDDSGAGIPAADRARVLRAGAGSGRGLGAGLAIVGWVMELHGGSLALTDAPGGGLRARLSFPPDRAP